MKASTAVMILRAILCQEELRAWLEQQAQASHTPIDNIMLKIIYTLLGCEKEG